MKRHLTLLLTAVLVFTLSGCGLKEAVQNKTYEVLNAVTGQKLTPTGGSGQGQSHTGTTPSGNQRPLASLPPGSSYEDRLEEEGKNAPNEG